MHTVKTWSLSVTLSPENLHQYINIPFSNIPHMSNVNQIIPSIKEIKNNPPPLSVSHHNSSSRLIVSERGVAFNKKTRYGGGAWVIQEINRTRHITDYLASHFHTERLPAVSISVAVSRQDFPVGPGREKCMRQLSATNECIMGVIGFKFRHPPPPSASKNWLIFQISVISLAFVK